MQLPEADILVEHLDSYRPSLKADIQNLTSLLSPLIEDQCLPDQRLQLEMLTESQIVSGEHTTRSLKELFEYSDDYSSFLTNIARSDLSQPNTEVSTDPLASFGRQAGGRPGPCILDPDDKYYIMRRLSFISYFHTCIILDYLCKQIPCIRQTDDCLRRLIEREPCAADYSGGVGKDPPNVMVNHLYLLRVQR
ncbi:hypothetical protein ACEPPN_010904 [Leptodophora sp. 'Broadleaf-Isolate-01']